MFGLEQQLNGVGVRDALEGRVDDCLQAVHESLHHGEGNKPPPRFRCCEVLFQRRCPWKARVHPTVSLVPSSCLR
mgnify:CR=1 FL=1